MTKEYLVTWKIDIDADNPEEAACKALIVQRDVESLALEFRVMDKETGVEVSVDMFHIPEHSPKEALELCESLLAELEAGGAENPELAIVRRTLANMKGV